METDGPLLDDFNMLKKTVEEEATEVRRSLERKAVCVCHRLRQSAVLNHLVQIQKEQRRERPLMRRKSELPKDVCTVTALELHQSAENMLTPEGQ